MVRLATRFVRRLRALIGRNAREHAMDDEMRFHLEMEAAELRRAGVPAAEARRRARLVFGGVERFKEEGRDARGTRLLEDLWQDLRYAVRQLRASPGYAAATVLTLGLGIGATTMIYNFQRVIAVEGVTIQGSDRLVSLGEGAEGCRRCASMTAGNYVAIRDRNHTLAHVSLMEEWEPNWRGSDRTELLDGMRVTTEFFQTLQIRPLLGRTLIPEDSAADRHQVVVLSEAMWRTRFGADQSVVGRIMLLDRTPYSIVGVVANDAMYPTQTDFWTPLRLTPELTNEGAHARYETVGRLRTDATAAQTAAEVAHIAAQIRAVSPAQLKDATLVAVPFADYHARRGDDAASPFTAAVLIVLLIACINLAGLLIARLSARRRELAVRRALGASPGRLARQLVAETMLLTSIAGVCGALLAAWGTWALVGVSRTPWDARAFVVALATGLGTGLLISLWPSLRFARPQLGLRESARGSRTSIDTARGRRALVVVEVALAIVLLSAAGLVGRTVQKIHAIDPGFDLDRVLAVRVRWPADATDRMIEADRIDRLVHQIEAAPAIERAGATIGVPFSHGAGQGSFAIDGQPALLPEQRPRARMQAATAGFFDALRIQIVRGRAFTDGDHATAPRVAVVNDVFAERFLSGQDPVGHTLVIDSLHWTIVGVARAIFHGDVEQIVAAEIYRPMQQWGRSQVWIAVRTRGDPAQSGPEVAAAVRQFDPDIAITRLLTMKELRENDMGSERRILRMMAAFALASVLISAIGLYGVISYAVAQRTGEFGVRLALGAKRRAVLRLVLIDGVRLAAVGALLGIAAAVATLRVIQSMLFGVTPTDPLTLGAVILAICGVALLAAYLPARRATLVDPMTAIRAE